jgi:hypothetical protein
MVWRIAVALLSVVTSAACSNAEKPEPLGVRFVSAPPALLRECRATARAVGYPVACPTRIPDGLAVGSDAIRQGRGSWRGWVVGSSYLGWEEHLVLTASPRRLTEYSKLVNGPAWYPGQRVRPLGWVDARSWRMREVYVPAVTNDGSAFMNHVVLVWSIAGHTYGIGFHNTRGISHALALDEELARGIRLVGP